MIRGKTFMKKNKNVTENINANFHNRFDIEVIDAKTGAVKQKAFAENVICNNLYSRLCGTTSKWNDYIHYGDGVGTPSSADTSLFGFIGYAQSTVHDKPTYDYDTNIAKVTKKITLSETTAVGRVLTEVGIAYGSSSTSLCTHAMLQDMNGNPISIEKTSTDIINIYATVFCHFSLNDKIHMTGWFDIDKSSGGGSIFVGNILCRILGIEAGYSGKHLYGGVNYAQGIHSTPLTRSYNVENRTVTYTATRVGASVWNIGGIKTLFFCTGTPNGNAASPPDIVFEIDQGNGWYEKTSIVGEAVATGDGVTTDFATKFPYAKNAKVYVDGVEVESNVTFDYQNTNIGTYLKLLQMPTAYRSGNATVGIFIFGHTSPTSNSVGITGGKKIVLENMLYKTHGISRIRYPHNNGTWVSNNLKDWVCINEGSTTEYDIPVEYQNYRYWILYSTFSTDCAYGLTITPNVAISNKNIHLTTPPAEGSVITIDYDSYTIAKDENHVFDFSVTFTFGEYTES